MGGWREGGDGTGDMGHRHTWEPGVGDGAGEDTGRVKDGEPDEKALAAARTPPAASQQSRGSALLPYFKTRLLS